MVGDSAGMDNVVVAFWTAAAWKSNVFKIAIKRKIIFGGERESVGLVTR
jgi:hypothetical protein